MPGKNRKSAFEAISDFEKDYFIQTRKEIDTEKQERNKLLNYGVVAIGAVAAGLLQLESKVTVSPSPWLLLVCIPVLSLVTGLVAARRIKLHQIADRWIALYRIARNFNIEKEWKPLERTVITGLIKGRYLKEDLWVHTTLSLVVYGLICYISRSIFRPPYVWAVVLIVVLSLHLFLTTRWLNKPFLNVEELAREFGHGG